MRQQRLWLALLICLVVLPGCGQGSGGSGDEAEPLTIMAASSLTDACNGTAAGFAGDTGIKVRVEIGGSAELVARRRAGAEGDVLATADEATMATAIKAGLVDGTPEVFATNRLAIVVAAGNPLGITGLADLTRPGLVVAMAAAEVPLGRYGREALAKAGVADLSPATEETSARGVLTKMLLGEADAGIVYASDVASAPSRVEGVAIPDEHNIVARYPMAILNSGRSADASRFIDFVRSAKGKTTLEQFGLGLP
ncbi:MAG: molybdate ABC transporter substrate-binding protein [Acidimicrobiales bacterium]